MSLTLVALNGYVFIVTVCSRQVTPGSPGIPQHLFSEGSKIMAKATRGNGHGNDWFTGGNDWFVGGNDWFQGGNDWFTGGNDWLVGGGNDWFAGNVRTGGNDW
jgi:hypothetical protein